MSKYKVFINEVFDVNNEYFAKMQEIIRNPNPLNKQYTEHHHIIPQFVYRDKNIEVDNSADNIVELSLENHILIHYYAAKCCFPCFKWKCLNSVQKTLGNIHLADFEKDCEEIARIIAAVKEEYRSVPMPDEIRKKCSYDHYRFTEAERKEKFGKHLIGNTYRLGVTLSKEIRAKISASRRGKSLGHNVSDETRKKISEANKGRKFGFDKDIRIAVGQFNRYRMRKLKEKFAESTITNWNDFQCKVKELKTQVVDELSQERQIAKRVIYKTCKEEVLTRVLERIP